MPLLSNFIVSSLRTKQRILIFFFFILLIPSSIMATLKTAAPHHPENFIESLKKDPKASEKIYLEFCAVCHDKDPQIPLGAPRIGVPSDWTSRHKTLDEMTNSVLEGLNAMPARGGCFECTDELLKAAIQYMIPKEKSKKID